MINEYSLKYHRKRLKDFWKRWGHEGLIHKSKATYRSIGWWIGIMDTAPMKAGVQAKSMIKDFIRIGVLEKKFSIEEGNRLWDLLKSPDKDDQYIGLSIIQTHYPHAFVKEKTTITLLEGHV